MTFDTKSEAQAWAGGIENAMRRGVFVSHAEAENTTLADALDRYAREVLPTKKSTRPVTYHARNVREGLGALSLAAITSSALAKYRDQQMAKGYAAQTVKHDLSLISHGLNICIKEWGIALPAGNPVTQVKRAVLGLPAAIAPRRREWASSRPPSARPRLLPVRDYSYRDLPDHR
ncbi:hypothetical protein C4900_04185 [Acidiferrobacter thiooxydans]|uniref:Core-binding (CB) domain-containing protein n=1 Tax=Acidiferrobacter thiooxydans TaxID=163359 RepID=A0A368HHV8_9GAMM|nr:hypothetical protein [Acidiferrobacter thiooxydans]RCN58961.1 hypothetical protein C4900_04185 [Acidiferrobacter thiooxydans]